MLKVISWLIAFLLIHGGGEALEVGPLELF